MKRLVIGMMIGGALSAIAMPTKQDLAKVQPLVNEVMGPLAKEYKAGTKKPAEVGAAAVEFAGQAETEAAKFLLLKGAVTYYARAGEYDKAADAIDSLKSNVKDVPSSVVAEIISKAVTHATAKEAPRLFELYKTAQCRAEAEKLAVVLAGKPSQRTKYAEVLAVAGDWPKALAEFAKLSGDIAAVAKAELEGKSNDLAAAEAWWSYKPTYADAEEVIKAHAAAFYRKALAAGKVTGLKKAMVEKRLQQVTVSDDDDAGIFVSAQSKALASGMSAVDGEAVLGAIAQLSGSSPLEKSRKVLGMMFPGWTLEKARGDENGGYMSSHRGRTNVFREHPVSQTEPAVISRMVAIPKKAPRLVLGMSSVEAVNHDYFLSVRVNDKEVQPDLVIQTPDYAPWEKVVVPLYDWAGRTVRIEILLKAKHGKCHHFNISTIAIVEGDGRRSKSGLVEGENGKASVGDYTWSFRVTDGGVKLVVESDGKYSCVVSPKPKGSLAIPAILDGLGVTSIDREAFFAQGELASVTIPEGVQSIAHCAFWGCKNLTAVTLPSTLKFFGRGAFWNCSALTSVEIPKGVSYIGVYAFRGCSSLESVILLGERPEAPTENVFSSCSKLTSIHVPAKAKSWQGMKTWQGVPLVFDAK